MTVNEEREQRIDFTTPYFESEMVMIAKKDETMWMPLPLMILVKPMSSDK